MLRNMEEMASEFGRLQVEQALFCVDASDTISPHHCMDYAFPFFFTILQPDRTISTISIASLGVESHSTEPTTIRMTSTTPDGNFAIETAMNK